MDDILAWVRLGSRLLAVSPKKFAKAMRAVERIVEGEEVVADFDDQLMVRSGRPEKRYEA